MSKNNNDNKKNSYIFTRETLGMTLLLFSALLLLAILTYNTVFSSIGAAICTFMYGTFGYGSYLVVGVLVLVGVRLAFDKKLIKVRKSTAATIGAAIFVVFLLFHAVTTRGFAMDSYGSYLAQCYVSAQEGYPGYTFGGAVSGILVWPVARATTFTGAYVIFSVLAVLCSYITFLVIRRNVRGGKVEVRGGEGEASPVADAAATYPADGSYTIYPEASYPVVPPAPTQPSYNPQPQYVPEQPPVSEQPVQQTDEDRFSRENLGRKILFENGEFAAESYRRNMIFNDDSYFNHPVHNEGDYLSSFSTGKKPAKDKSVPAGTYSESYSQEVERSEQVPATPSYIYGDKPADSFDDYMPHAQNGNEAYFEDGSADYEEPIDYSSESYDYYEEKYDDAWEEDYSRGDGGETAYEDVYGGDSMSSDDEHEEDIPVSHERNSGDVLRMDGGLTEHFAENSANETDGSDSAADNSGEDAQPILRRNLTPRESDSGDGQATDIRSIFSSSNTNISDSIQPDSSRISSRRGENSAALPQSNGQFPSGEDQGDNLFGGVCDGGRRSLRGEETDREHLFDSDHDDYLDDDGEADLGTQGLKPVRGRDEAMRRSEQVNPVGKQEEKPAEPPKPKHVWKKYVRPGLELLRDYPENNAANLAEIEENKALIIETLENFRIASHIADVTIGPAITRYDVVIEDRTNIKNAMRYRENIAMALMKENVNAYLNYPKGAISIEVPNSQRTTVGLKALLTSSEFINCKSNSLTFALGKNVDGKACCPDITKMPHLLVAGTTGSGKSVCLSSLIISLLYKYGPDELRFILVDPKQSEFITYENLPHLIINEIIYDVDKAIKALNWAIKEMERRYTLFKEKTLAGTLVKNLTEYNAHLGEDEEKLPKIVIILDEFGDLMLQNKKDIESRIIRLVQKSRACGIHLILATQRPSVDCITGLIKSNLPTRIGFKVNSFDDSRTIFDVGGAEKLLGNGDMYFRSASNPDLARIQGCFIDAPEIQAVTDFVKKNNETYFDQSVSDFINTVEAPEGDGGDAGGDDGDVKIDDKFIQALKFCVTNNQASVSMLQRRFPIGYVKACKIIDWMENMNYITQSEGAKPRKVLLSLDEFTRIYGDVDD